MYTFTDLRKVLLDTIYHLGKKTAQDLLENGSEDSEPKELLYARALTSVCDWLDGDTKALVKLYE